MIKVVILYSNKRTLKLRSMKVSKQPVLSMASMTQKGGRKNIMATSASRIRLKPVTNVERQQLRISSYRYLLP